MAANPSGRLGPARAGAVRFALRGTRPGSAKGLDLRAPIRLALCDTRAGLAEDLRFRADARLLDQPPVLDTEDAVPDTVAYDPLAGLRVDDNTKQSLLPTNEGNRPLPVALDESDHALTFAEGRTTMDVQPLSVDEPPLEQKGQLIAFVPTLDYSEVRQGDVGIDFAPPDPAGSHLLDRPFNDAVRLAHEVLEAFVRQGCGRGLRGEKKAGEEADESGHRCTSI